MTFISFRLKHSLEWLLLLELFFWSLDGWRKMILLNSINMSVIATWSPIETYTALYIKAVRTRGYNKSLYAFVSSFGESNTIKEYANRVMRGFITEGLMTRKSYRVYSWNRNGKYILAEELHEFCSKYIKRWK